MSGFKLRSTPHGSSSRYWLDAISYVGDLSVMTLFSRNGGGLAEVKWQMDLPSDFDHPALRRGARVEVMDSGLRVGYATLGEPGRTNDGISFVADGLFRDAERFLCFDDAGDSTTIANEAIDTAIANYHLGWSRLTSISANAMKTGSITDSLNYLDTLLTALAIELGKFWWVDADGAIRMDSKPTDPTYHLTPGFSPPGIDDTDYASHLFARYLSGASLLTRNLEDTAASARWGYRQMAVDLTSLGSISSGRADNRLAGLIARGQSKLRHTERIEVSPSELLTNGGNPAALSSVRAGRVVRMHGLTSYSQWLNGKSYLDFVIGEATWTNGADTISLAPLDFTGKSLTDRLTRRGAVPLSA